MHFEKCGRALFCREKLKNKQKGLDKKGTVWYIIARKDESDVLNSLSQPDAKVGINAKRQFKKFKKSLKQIKRIANIVEISTDEKPMQASEHAKPDPLQDRRKPTCGLSWR